VLESFRQGLRDLGYVEGQDVLIDYRWAERIRDRFSTLAAELTQLKLDVIVTYTSSAVTALQQATRTIPIVVASMGDPVGSGFVASLARPGGNITGFTGLSEEVSRKWVELRGAKSLSRRRPHGQGHTDSGRYGRQQHPVERHPKAPPRR
jgi:putative tryptophan/tyrosine transport system substrate-binding protein